MPGGDPMAAAILDLGDGHLVHGTAVCPDLLERS